MINFWKNLELNILCEINLRWCEGWHRRKNRVRETTSYRCEDMAAKSKVYAKTREMGKLSILM